MDQQVLKKITDGIDCFGFDTHIEIGFELHNAELFLTFYTRSNSPGYTTVVMNGVGSEELIAFGQKLINLGNQVEQAYAAKNLIESLQQ